MLHEPPPPTTPFLTVNKKLECENRGRVSMYINLTQFSCNPFISLLQFPSSQMPKKHMWKVAKKGIWINILGLVNINYKCKYYVRIFYYYLCCCCENFPCSFHFNANTYGTCLFFVLTSVAFFYTFSSSPCFSFEYF